MADAFYEKFGRLLRDARLKTSLTQALLGSRVGLSRSSIANIERGVQQLPLHLLPRLAKILGVLPSSLLPPDEDDLEMRVRELAKKEDLRPELQEILLRNLSSRGAKS